MKKNYFSMPNKNASVSERIAFVENITYFYTHASLSKELHDRAEHIISILLEDPSPKVRYALAQHLSSSASAPAYIMDALASDQLSIAGIVLTHSPVLNDLDLINRISCEPHAARFIASRSGLSSKLRHEIIQTQDPEACLALLKNPQAGISHGDFCEIVKYFSTHSEIREILVEDKRLPVESRCKLLFEVPELLKKLPLLKVFLSKKTFYYKLQEEYAKKIIVLINQTTEHEWPALIDEIHSQSFLTSGFIIRLLAYGKIEFIAAVFASLSGINQKKVKSILDSGLELALTSLLIKVGMGAKMHPPILKAFAFYVHNRHKKECIKPENISRVMIGSVLHSDENNDLISLLKSIHFETMRSKTVSMRCAA